MKKILCMLLAFTMLVLTAMLSACETAAPADKTTSTASSEAPKVATPWSQLKTLIGEMNQGLESQPILDSLFATTSDIYGTGSVNLSANASLQGMDESQEMSGTFTLAGNTMKMETVADMFGAEIPMVYWQDGDASYIQYPTLYSDKVFDANDLSDSSVSPSTGMGFPVAFGDLGDKLLKAFEELAAPDEFMTVSEQDGVKTFTLTLGAKQAQKLFDRIEAILEEIGLMDMLEGENNIMDQLSTDSSDDSPFDTAVFTVTTDSETYINYQLQTFLAAEVVESLLITVQSEDSSIIYTIESKSDDTTQLSLTFAIADDKITLQGEIPMEQGTLKLELNLTVESETKINIDGTLTISMAQGGLSIAIPLTIQGHFLEDDKTMEFKFNLGMNFMGMSMDINMGYTITLCDVTLEIPFTEDDVIKFDEEDFYDKLMEAYPDLFEDTSREYGSSDGNVYLILYDELNGDLSCNGTYEQTGDTIQITVLGPLMVGPITKEGGAYYLNGEELDAYEFEGTVYLSYGDDYDWMYTLTLFEDNTCVFASAFMIDEASDTILFADGNSMPAENLQIVDGFTIRFCGVDLYDTTDMYFEEEVIYSTDDMDLRLSISPYNEYRFAYTTTYQLDGNTLNLKGFGEYELTVEDGSYFLSETPCQYAENEENLVLSCERDYQRLTLTLHKDDTCSMVLQGYPDHDYEFSTLTIPFKDGEELSVKLYFNHNATKVTIFGKVLELISGDAVGM